MISVSELDEISNLSIEKSHKNEKFETPVKEDALQERLTLEEMKYGDVIKNNKDHQAYRMMMICRLAKVGLSENKYENLIRSTREEILT